ncbi:MAG: ABC transporter permease [Gammaproteobacteria bacterium]|nr:ABC transporter permease [Gammaproteobacteria bacterium]
MDTLLRDLRHACRALVKTPGVTLTVVTTLALGLGLVAAVFSILNLMVFQADAVRAPEELYAVLRQQPAQGEPEPFTHAQHEALLRETDLFADASAIGPTIDRWVEGQRMEGPFVSGNFFRMLGVSAARGRVFTPADDLAGNRVLVLSQLAWKRYFASDPGIIGRAIRVNDQRFDVLGVMPDGFRGLRLDPPDFWLPLALAAELRQVDRDALAVMSVGRLRPGLSQAQALAQLGTWDQRRAVETLGARPATSLALEPNRGTVPLSADMLLVFLPLFFAFGLILLIGCANVANLLLARGVVRQREVGIRLALGAARHRIVRQLLTESVLLALLAAACGFGVSRLVLHAVVRFVTSSLASLGDIRLAVPPPDWRVALFLIAAAIVSTLFFALAPALTATRVELVRAIHGEVAHHARPSRARNTLVALQVMGAAVLLICAAIFLRSSWQAAATSPGVRTADTMFVSLPASPLRGAMLDTIRGEPSVAMVAAATPVAANVLVTGATGKVSSSFRLVSPEYFDVLGIDLARGRGFAPGERTATASVAIISESAARTLWPAQDPLGQMLTLDPDPNLAAPPEGTVPPLPRTSVVVGIARDVAGFRLGGQKVLAGPDLYLPITAETAGTSLALRVRGDPELTRRALSERLSALAPDTVEMIPLRELARAEADLLKIPFWLTLVLGALALFLTLSGLFSVLSYLVAQRTREIGVRHALGATRGRITALALAQAFRPVGIGLLAGALLPAAVGALLLATPAAELIGQTVRLFDPLAYLASLLLIVAACAGAALLPALRAGSIDPLVALRTD